MQKPLVKRIPHSVSLLVCSVLAIGYLSVSQSVAEEASKKETPWAFQPLRSVQPPAGVSGQLPNAIARYPTQLHGSIEPLDIGMWYKSRGA